MGGKMSALPEASTQSVPLLSTKLAVPPLQAGLVARPRLIERVNEGLRAGRQMTLVSAPAGFGKTTLVSAWLSELDRPSAWLSLDEGDNDAVRFLSYLIAALQRADPEIGRSVQSLQQSPEPPQPEALWVALINDIAITPRPLLLVLDDYHLIHTIQIHQQLAYFLGHLPQQMHVAISTREDPPLPLSRLRARGQMSEIRQADLRFSRQEAAVFLNATMGLGLTVDDVAALEARTEGWIAGLQLAALSMRQTEDLRGFVQSFTGSNRYILDYLSDEVIERQPRGMREFLLQTSILERLSAPLCDAVTGGDNSQDILLTLEQGNLFLVPLDESRQWYRYHRLFAELLRHRLRTEASAPDARELHQRASRWYEAEGYPADAVRHALAASDWEQAARLILEVSGSMLERGEVMTLLGWFRELPDEAVCVRPGLCLNYSWVLILTGQLDTAESYLSHVERTVVDDAALLGGIVAAQAYIARTRGDHRRTIELSQRALTLLPQDDLSARSVVALNLGLAHWHHGHLAEAQQTLEQASHAALQSGNRHVRLMALGLLGPIQAAQGKLHQAAVLCRQAIQLGKQSPAIALTHLEFSALLYVWNDLEAVADQLRQAIELSQRSGNLELQTGGYRMLARLKQAQGDASGALAALQEAHLLARSHDVTPLVRARNAACHVEIALAQDDVATAMHWAEQVTEDADAFPLYPFLRLTPARLLLAQNKKGAAAEQLAALYETAIGSGWQFGAVEVRTLQALAAADLDQALDYLAEAIAQAEPEGYVRTFVDKGEPMASLLREAAVRGIAPAYAGRLLSAFAASSGTLRDKARPGIAEQPLPEPLSEREWEALRLLAEGLSYQEIAAAMFLSLNTVKTHLKNVYAKLGVHERQDAVARARELQLLS
jgi:LuxR family maltose regulon positive regulatory protein